MIQGRQPNKKVKKMYFTTERQIRQFGTKLQMTCEKTGVIENMKHKTLA